MSRGRHMSWAAVLFAAVLGLTMFLLSTWENHEQPAPAPVPVRHVWSDELVRLIQVTAPAPAAGRDG